MLYMPMGLFCVADAARRSGRSVRIVNLALDVIAGQKPDPLVHIRRYRPRVVALDLHWHYQLPDVLETARVIKAAAPETFVLLGGLTASLFHEDILKGHPQIDAIIRGEGEIPISGFLDAFIDNGGMDGVPNLSLRDGSGIRINPLSFVATPETLGVFSFTPFELLDKADLYVRYVKAPWYWVKGVGKIINRRVLRAPQTVFPLMTIRGCSANCSFCGGAKDAASYINGRKSVSLRPLGAVMRSVTDAAGMGYDLMYAEASPLAEHREYYLDLIREMGRRFDKTGLILECRGLASNELIEAFSRAFPRGKNGSRIHLSPESASERVRRKNKGYFYDNKQFANCLDSMRRQNVKAEIYFMFGLPGDNLDTISETRGMIQRLLGDEALVSAVRVDRAVIDPGCLMARKAEEYGVVRPAKTLDDFMALHSNNDPSWNISIGYGVAGVFPDIDAGAENFPEIYDRKLKGIECDNFCRLRKSLGLERYLPASTATSVCRGICRASEAYWRLTEKAL